MLTELITYGGLEDFSPAVHARTEEVFDAVFGADGIEVADIRHTPLNTATVRLTYPSVRADIVQWISLWITEDVVRIRWFFVHPVGDRPLGKAEFSFSDTKWRQQLLAELARVHEVGLSIKSPLDDFDITSVVRDRAVTVAHALNRMRETKAIKGSVKAGNAAVLTLIPEMERSVSLCEGGEVRTRYPWLAVWVWEDRVAVRWSANSAHDTNNGEIMFGTPLDDPCAENVVEVVQGLFAMDKSLPGWVAAR